MRFLFILFFFLSAASVWARDLPVDGVQADLTALEYPYVRLAGKAARLAPGARIHDEANRVIQPNVLPAKAKVVYTLDTRGDVQEIWLLTADEISVLKRKKTR